MYSFLRPALCFLAAASLLGCHKERCEPAPMAATSLTGHWLLVQRTCFCPPGAVPNEEAVFTGTSFAFTQNGQPLGSGAYTDSTATLCSGIAPVSALRFTYVATTANPTPLVRTAELSLSGNTLVLDYGSPCDAPRDTYQRVP